AIRLRLQGFDVEVFEQNNYPGGKLSDFKLGNFQFDAGPSLFTQPQLIQEIFELAGEKINDHFEYHRLPVSCNYFYEDGTRVNAFADRVALANELYEKLHEPVENTNRFLNQSANIYNSIGTFFLQNSLHKKTTLFKKGVWNALKQTRLQYLFKSMHQLHEQEFKSAKTVQLFNRYATYNGSNPYKAPAMYEGSFYPKGGMISITKSLYELALRKGVVFHFNSKVDSIITSENIVLGIVVKGKNHLADCVVSNMDVYFTYKHLLKNETLAAKVLKQERSSSAYIFYWGVKREFSELSLHNIFFTKDYRTEFDHLFNRKTVYSDPTIYIHITSKCEPGVHAPAGKENWFVMVNAPANRGQNWEEEGKRIRSSVLIKLSSILGVEIEPLIEEEQVLTPESIESKTASYMGSLYGTSSNGKMAAFMRHPNFSNQIKGLYFVGGSVHPGGGIPLCLNSAKIMGDIVEKDYSK
ncbi:MAG: phytoene desaturase, partial [Sphingobacteriia bacterium]